MTGIEADAPRGEVEAVHAGRSTIPDVREAVLAPLVADGPLRATARRGW